MRHPVDYHPDGGALLHHLCAAGLLETVDGRPAHAVLLETADTATREHLSTILVTDVRTRLRCQGSRVQARPTGTDRSALDLLAADLADAVVSDEPDLLVLDLACEPSPWESQRLRRRSPLEALRVLGRRDEGDDRLPLLVGAFAFDFLACLEELPQVPQGPNTCPDYLFNDVACAIVMDHRHRSAEVVGIAGTEDRMAELAQCLAGLDATADPRHPTTPPVPHGDGEPLEVDVDVSDDQFRDVVVQMQESIRAGDIYQVVPSRTFSVACPDALAAYRHLRVTTPSPYMFYLADDDFELFGASPESSLSHHAADRSVTIRPIAGTSPRGLDAEGHLDPELDVRHELALRTDAKEISEHVMLVDLARNDVARVSVPGTRHVPTLMRVDRYSRVMHLVSEVVGELRPDLDALDAFGASMTMGTLTGAPKLRAAELIRAVEGQRRGSYGGAVGYLRGDGEFDTCIVIRAAFVRRGEALVQAGAGVVAASDPQSEADETRHKASAVLAAIAASQGRELA